MRRTLDDLRGALHDEADGTENPDVESLLTGARRRVAATRRRRLGVLSAATAALVVVGGVVAVTLPRNQALPQPAGPGPSSVKATDPGADVVAQATKPPVNLVAQGYAGRFRTFATVVQTPRHGIRLCHVTAASLPPYCAGPGIIGWEWGNLKSESLAGTRWGSYVLVGTWADGLTPSAPETFTLTEPAVADDGTVQRPASRSSEISTPCPQPAGGWQPVDPARATSSAFEAASRRAQAESGFGGLWIHQQNLDGKGNANNPRKFILNVTTTGDVAAMERKLRVIWGGSLCVSKAARSEAELSSAQTALSNNPVPGTVSLGIDVTAGQLVVELMVATQERQRELDQQFGKGAVRLQGLLAPVD